MVSNARITVGIPAYNSSKYIEQCISSILHQQYDNIEIIVIDDGSTDDTLDICRSLSVKDDRIKIVHQMNQGPSASRNRIIDLATGEYLMFVDADDWLSPFVLRDVFEAFRPEADLLSYRYCFHDGNVVIKNEGIPEYLYSDCNGLICSDIYLEYIYNGYVGNYSWQFLYRIDVLRDCKTRFPEKVRLLEDAVMLNELLRNRLHVQCVDRVVYNYRDLPSSVSHSVNKERAESGVQALRMLLERADMELDSYPKYILNLAFYIYSMFPMFSKSDGKEYLNQIIHSYLIKTTFKEMDKKLRIKSLAYKTHLLSLLNLMHRLL